jgi:hypothetical protein
MRARVRGFLVVDDPGEAAGRRLVQVLAGPSDGPGEESFHERKLDRLRTQALAEDVPHDVEQ